MAVNPNGNRAARRTSGMGGPYRPAADIAATQVGGFVYLGLRGAGFVRLSVTEARQLVLELDELVIAAQGALS